MRARAATVVLVTLAAAPGIAGAEQPTTASASQRGWELGLGLSTYYNGNAPGEGSSTSGVGVTVRAGRRAGASWSYGVLVEVLLLHTHPDSDEERASQQDLVFFVRGYLTTHLAVEGALGASRYTASGVGSGCDGGGGPIFAGCFPAGPFDKTSIKASLQGGLVLAVPIEDELQAEVGLRLVVAPGSPQVDQVAPAPSSMRADAALIARF